MHRGRCTTRCSRTSTRTPACRARNIARQWGERWISVAADQAIPHQLMAELYTYDSEYQAALREIASAESLGIQTPTWNPRAKRAALLIRSGNLTEGARLAGPLAPANF